MTMKGLGLWGFRALGFRVMGLRVQGYVRTVASMSENGE